MPLDELLNLQEDPDAAFVSISKLISLADAKKIALKAVSYTHLAV